MSKVKLKQEKEAEPPPPSWDETPLAKTPIMKLMKERQQLYDAKKEVEGQIDAIEERMGGLLKKHQLVAVDVGRWRGRWVTGTRKTLDKRLLLKQGVTMLQITRATKETQTKPSFRVYDLESAHARHAGEAGAGDSDE